MRSTEPEPAIFTWFPRREDYEDAPVVLPDETLEEKIARLNETIEASQDNIKEVVDGYDVSLEHKIYRTMDLRQDMTELADLLKECVAGADKVAKDDDPGHLEGIKKAKVGLINLKAYLSQVDCIEFAQAIRNEFQFKVGCQQGFGPWLAWAEKRIGRGLDKPCDFDQALRCEEEACIFLKEVVRSNKGLKLVQTACEGLRGDVEAHEALAKLQERYYVLCKKAEQRVKNINHLLNEWKRLEDILLPTDPQDMDDLTPKQIIIFLRTYAAYFA